MQRQDMVLQKSPTATSHQIEVLTVLSGSPACSIGEIASAFGVSYAAASKMVHRLEEKGFVVCSLNEMDRRVTDVRITQTGLYMIRLFNVRPERR